MIQSVSNTVANAGILPLTISVPNMDHTSELAKLFSKWKKLHVVNQNSRMADILFLWSLPFEHNYIARPRGFQIRITHLKRSSGFRLNQKFWPPKHLTVYYSSQESKTERVIRRLAASLDFLSTQFFKTKKRDARISKIAIRRSSCFRKSSPFEKNFHYSKTTEIRYMYHMSQSIELVAMVALLDSWPIRNSKFWPFPLHDLEVWISNCSIKRFLRNWNDQVWKPTHTSTHARARRKTDSLV